MNSRNTLTIVIIAFIFIHSYAQPQFSLDQYQNFVNNNRDLNAADLLSSYHGNTYYKADDTNIVSSYSYLDTIRSKYHLTQDEMDLLTALTEQLNVALEGARLYQDSQRRAAREQLAGEVTGRIREAVEIEAVLQRALAELGQAFDAERGTVYLALDAQQEASV